MLPCQNIGHLITKKPLQSFFFYFNTHTIYNIITKDNFKMARKPKETIRLMQRGLYIPRAHNRDFTVYLLRSLYHKLKKHGMADCQWCRLIY